MNTRKKYDHPSSSSYIYTLLLTALIFLQLSGFGQENASSFFTSRLQRSAIEKVFVHTSQSFYVTGETMWFKIYVTAGSAHLLSPVSKVAYATIYDVSQKQVLQAKIAIDSGSGGGSWVIPASISSGQYLLSAYTNLTKNSIDPAFEQWITIINPSKPPAPSINESNKKPMIQFFPEGGDFVNGIQNTLGFKITGSEGRPLQASGAILNDKNDTITWFQSLHEGLGRLNLTPQPGEVYRAILFSNEAATQSYPLPNSKQEGYLLNLKEMTAEEGIIDLQSFPAKENEKYHLIFHSEQTIFKIIDSTFNKGKSRVIIPLTLLQEGVTTVTLFNSNYKAVAERLLYISPGDTSSLQVRTPQKEFQVREKVSLFIQSLTAAGKASPVDLSMAVFKNDSLLSVPESNIVQYLLLTSVLKGTIDSPEFYFSNSPNVKDAIENLLLTHGWRKVSSIKEDALANSPFPFPEYSGHIISGTITYKSTGLPAKNIRTFLTVPGERFHFSNCISDENGRIQFDVKKIFGTESIIVQTNPLKDSLYRIAIDNPFINRKEVWVPPAMAIPLERRKELEARITAAQVQTAYSGNRFQTFYLPQFSDTTSFYGKPDVTYLLDDYTRFTTMEEVLREYVLEVQVRKSQDQFRLKVLNLPYKQFFEENPLVLLDGLPVFDINKVIAIDPLKIRKLDILNRRYYQGSYAFDGITSFLSYNGDLAGYNLDPTALVVEYPGLQLQRQFYQPNYEVISEKDRRLPDYRQLLYWSSDLKIRETGTTSLNFFTSDVPGNYTIIVQGITASGKPVFTTQTISVK